MSPGGGTGRRGRLKIYWVSPVPVRVRPRAPSFIVISLKRVEVPMKKIIVLFIMLSFFLIACSSNGTSGKTVNIKGLNGKVKVYTDNWGIYHIYADNDYDLFFVQGYLEAKSRLFFMDFIRHLSDGSLGEILGDVVPLVKDLDRFMLETIYGPDGKSSFEKTYEKSSPEVKKELEAFSAGINAFINEVKNGKMPLPDGYKLYDLKANFIRYWTPYDTFAIGRFAQLALSSIRTITWKISRALWEDKLPENIKEDWIRWKVPTRTSILFGKQSFSPSAKYYNKINDGDLLKFYSAFKAILDFMGIGEFYGSNNWVWSGNITKNGDVILANDPHLPLLTPPVWQGFYLDSKSHGNGKFRMMGYVLSGIPGIMIGFNENLAWGVTMTGYDVADVYQQQIYKGKDGYYVKKINGDIKLKSVTVPYKVRVDSNKWVERGMQIFYIPDDSVLIMWDDLATDPFAKPPTDGTAISFRWPGYDASFEMEAYYRLFTASTVNDFVNALNYFGVGAQNFIMGNRFGDIAYYPHALIPIRSPGSRPWRLMDGYDNEGEWIGYLPNSKIPKLVDPKRGYISTANNDIFGVLHGKSFEPPYLINGSYYYFSKWPGYRAERIDDLINIGKRKNELDVKYSMKMQQDVYSLLATQFVPDILEAADSHPDLLQEWESETGVNYEEAVNLLRNWSYHIYSGVSYDGKKYNNQMRLDSAATSIFEAWFKFMKQVVYADEAKKYGVPLPETGLPCTYIKSLYYIMKFKKDSPLFDNVFTPQVETRDYDILLALKDAVDKMLSLQKVKTINELRWGNVHKLTMFSADLPLTRMGIPTDGDDFTVDPGGQLSADNVNNYLHLDGASVRMIVEFNSKGFVQAFGVLPGSSLENWRKGFDQLPMWLTGQYHPLIFNESKLKNYTVSVVTFK